jgi:hypothetical protein
MKFILSDKPASYDEIYQAIGAYMKANENKRPSYILVHPESRRNILISSGDEMRGIRYTVVEHRYGLPVEHGIKSETTVFGLYLIKTEDVEPGFMIICG